MTPEEKSSIPIPKTYLVVLALLAAGGEADLETIAVKAHELFPGQFCWRNYPQFPDKDAVRVHLSEAKKAAFGGLIADRDLRKERRAGGGYMKRFALTAAGLEKAKQLEALMGNTTLTAKQNPLDYQRLIQPMLESVAFRQYRGGRAVEDIDRDAFLGAFKLFGDASSFVIGGRLARAQAAVERLTESPEKLALMKFIREGRLAHGL